MPTLEVKTIGGTTIYVNDKGRFSAEIDGRIVTRASLRPLERLIEQRSDPLPVMIPRRRWDWRVDEDELIRLVGDNLKSERTAYKYFSDSVFVRDEDALAELKELLVEHKDLCARWDAILSRLTRVTRGNFENLRKKMGKKGG